jgi:hypothetical protein
LIDSDIYNLEKPVIGNPNLWAELTLADECVSYFNEQDKVLCGLNEKILKNNPRVDAASIGLPVSGSPSNPNNSNSNSDFADMLVADPKNPWEKNEKRNNSYSAGSNLGLGPGLGRESYRNAGSKSIKDKVDHPIYLDSAEMDVLRTESAFWYSQVHAGDTVPSHSSPSNEGYADDDGKERGEFDNNENQNQNNNEREFMLDYKMSDYNDVVYTSPVAVHNSKAQAMKNLRLAKIDLHGSSTSNHSNHSNNSPSISRDRDDRDDQNQSKITSEFVEKVNSKSVDNNNNNGDFSGSCKGRAALQSNGYDILLRKSTPIKIKTSPRSSSGAKEDSARSSSPDTVHEKKMAIALCQYCSDRIDIHLSEDQINESHKTTTKIGESNKNNSWHNSDSESDSLFGKANELLGEHRQICSGIRSIDSRFGELNLSLIPSEKQLHDVNEELLAFHLKRAFDAFESKALLNNDLLQLVRKVISFNPHIEPCRRKKILLGVRELSIDEWSKGLCLYL